LRITERMVENMLAKIDMECQNILARCYRDLVFKSLGKPNKLARYFRIVTNAIEKTLEMDGDSCHKDDVLQIALAAFISACEEYFMSVGQVPNILIRMDQRTGLMKLSFKFNNENICDFDLCEGVETDWCHPYESQ